MMNPYLRLMRFDKPIGIWLLLWPTLIALWLCHHGMPPIKMLAIFVAGVIIMRALGCIANDLCDRHIDQMVCRTQQRPLASGELSVLQACILMLLLSIAALGLVLLLNRLALYVAIVAIALTGIYPLCKRFFLLPQLVLGITFNLGVLLAFASTHQLSSPLAWLFYASVILWTLAYDTIYALQDKQDDERIGIHSSALTFGAHTTLFIGVCQTLTLLCWVWLGINSHFGWAYYTSISLSLILMGHQHQLMNKHRYTSAFALTHWQACVVLVGIIY